jgi:ABC-type phosphate/phosphonate transport system substrate-binding protein
MSLHKLLSARLGVQVLDCPLADRRSAAAALAGGSVDMAELDPGSYTLAADKVRAILTVTPKGAPGRVPVVVAVAATSGITSFADLKGRRAVFAGPANYDFTGPRAALADQGAGKGFFSTEIKAEGASAAAQLLRSRGADALVLNGDAWERTCRGETPNAKPCSDLKIVWRGRPRAKTALAVRRDMPAQIRYRLVGIYVAMHLESPEAFAAASVLTPGAGSFDPTEAEALSPAMAAPSR